MGTKFADFEATECVTFDMFGNGVISIFFVRGADIRGNHFCGFRFGVPELPAGSRHAGRTGASPLAKHGLDYPCQC